ncbi:MAG: Eco57I restriction-modification methylase domain-containing protein, partial [Deltaproteobacteria bacterium]|nr:Eco57I restriction-modification methylase domain-containing protein [Deltaproteobacteria bacterium]
IGPDFYEGQQTSFLDEEEMYRVNVFDWESEFKEIMQDGGFDAVIGNPPYVRIQAMKEWAPLEVEFYKKRYVAASKGNYDIYVIFVERALNLLGSKGQLGYIMPNKFFATDYGKELRKIISERNALSCLVDFGHEQVFAKATTYTCLLFLSGSPLASFEYTQVAPSPKILTAKLGFEMHPSDLLSEKPWLFMSSSETNLFTKLKQSSIPLLELPAAIGRGSSSGNDKIFMLQRTSLPNTYLTWDGEEIEIEDNILRIPLFATDFTRYHFTPKSEKVIIFPYCKHTNNFQLLSEAEFKTIYPQAFQYLYSHKKELEQRKQYKAWYGFSAPRNLSVHDTAQMIVPLLAHKGLLADLPGNREDYCLMASGGFSITINNRRLLPRYVLGILNSRLLFWYLKFISNRFRGGWITCTKQYVGKLPIRTINFSDHADKTRHDRMVELVDQMLDLNKQLAEAKTPQTKTVLQRQIETTDRQIDRLVYELYELTEDEIRIAGGK